jgi:hypothetical protein
MSRPVLTPEEWEVIEHLPIYFTRNGSLPPELQHLGPALARLEARGIVTTLHDRWALTQPWQTRSWRDRG